MRVERIQERVEIFFDGEKIADTRHAVKLEEAGSEPIYYVPREDLVNVELVQSEKHTYSPVKGEAEFYSLRHGPALWENLGWSYENPEKDLEEIKGLIAFDPSQIEYINVEA